MQGFCCFMVNRYESVIVCVNPNSHRSGNGISGFCIHQSYMCTCLCQVINKTDRQKISTGSNSTPRSISSVIYMYLFMSMLNTKSLLVPIQHLDLYPLNSFV